MTTNTWNNTAKITKAAMKYLENNLTFAKHVNRAFDSNYNSEEGKIGDTLSVRIAGYGSRTSGKVASPSGYNETYAQVTLTQQNASVLISSKEMALNVDDLMEHVIGPQIATLVNGIDADGLALYYLVNQSVGTPGTTPTDLQYFLDAKALLSSQAVPQDGNIAAIIDPFTEAKVVGGLKTLYNPQQDISEMYRSGNMGRIAGGMKFSMDQNIVSHTSGSAAGSPVMAATAADGATTLNISGWTSGQVNLKKGDVITVADCYAVNPVSKLSTGQLMQFVVTADTSDSSGNTATLAISPTIHTTGPNQNVSAAPTQSKVVKFFGGSSTNTYASKVSPVGLVFHKDAFILACRDLPRPSGMPAELCGRVKSPKLNMSVRMCQWYDARNDDDLWRLDVLYGWAIGRQNFAVRVQS